MTLEHILIALNVAQFVVSLFVLWLLWKNYDEVLHNRKKIQDHQDWAVAQMQTVHSLAGTGSGARETVRLGDIDSDKAPSGPAPLPREPTDQN